MFSTTWFLLKSSTPGGGLGDPPPSPSMNYAKIINSGLIDSNKLRPRLLTGSYSLCAC